MIDKSLAFPEDPDRRNLTPGLLSLIGDLVGAMGGKFPRVHHNAELGRPFAPEAEDGFPLKTFLSASRKTSQKAAGRRGNTHLRCARPFVRELKFPIRRAAYHTARAVDSSSLDAKTP